jgi:hypothetical protein
MKGVSHRIALFFKTGWQWLTATPRYRGALLCALSAIGAMIAIGYNGSKGIFSPSAPVTQTSDVVAARISAMSDGLRASNAENSLPKNGIGNTEVVEPSPVDNDSRIQRKGPSARAIASDKSFLVAEAEKTEKSAIQDKDKVRKTAKKSAKKKQQPVSSDRDRKFSPSREIKRAGERITSVIRDIF